MANQLSCLYTLMVALTFLVRSVQKRIVMFVNMHLKRKWNGRWRISAAITSTTFNVECFIIEYRMCFELMGSTTLAVTPHSPFDIRKFDIVNAFQIIWQHQKLQPLQQRQSK
jgi:hypothetical protein